jgi:chromosome segregation ATPase
MGWLECDANNLRELIAQKTLKLEELQAASEEHTKECVKAELKLSALEEDMTKLSQQLSEKTEQVSIS